MNKYEKLRKEKLVQIKDHIILPLKLLNYTYRAQLKKKWCGELLIARGLVVREDGMIVARPVPKFFNDYDVLICPSHSSQCFLKDESENLSERRITIRKNNTEMVIPYHQPLFWAFLTNVGNLPSTTFPCGIKNGLPVCLNVVSKVYHDNITIDFARLLKAEGGSKYSFTPPPGYEKGGSPKI